MPTRLSRLFTVLLALGFVLAPGARSWPRRRSRPTISTSSPGDGSGPSIFGPHRRFAVPAGRS